MVLRQALAPVIDAIYPPRCPLCGTALANQAGLCVTCWGELEIPATPACRSCQRPFPLSVPADEQCGPCLDSPPVHDGIAAATIYNPASRRLVLAFKHGGRLALAPVLARLMAARLMAAQVAIAPLGQIESQWVLVPVPLHRWRLWRRGYNQSAVLAGELARLTGASLAVDALQRCRRTPSLAGLGREARAAALAGAIRPNPRWATGLQGASVVLVDDVLTSGATTNACIAALRHAGARRVVITCFARVMDDALV